MVTRTIVPTASESTGASAIWVFKDILGIDKNDLNARRFLARSLKEVGDLEGAINYYEQIRKLDPSDKEAADEVRNLSAQGTSSNMQKRLASGKGYKALVNTDQAAKLERLSARVRTADQARERIIDLKDELEKEPDSTKIMVMISDMHVMLKEWAEAKEWLEKVTEIDPDDFQAKEKLGDLKLKQYDDMIAKLKGAAKKDPSAKAKYEKAVAEKRKFEIEEFRKRFEAHPTELKYAYMLGKALHEAGNHDEAISYKIPKRFKRLAAKAAFWTRRQIKPGRGPGMSDRRRWWSYVKKFPYTEELGPWVMAHGSLDSNLDYVHDKMGALEVFEGMNNSRIAFLGHTHVPGIFLLGSNGEDVHYIEPEDGKRYSISGRRAIINVGSVGQPRDGDPRACWVLAREDGSFSFRRVPYDVEKTMGKISMVDRLPEYLALRLKEGR